MHVDMRTQVMTLDGLKALADKMAEGGMNTLIMEWEASLPFARNATLSNKYAYKPEEVKEFVSYCSSLGIDVIPLQNCFGHCEYILRHERYAAIRENDRMLSQVCPLSEKADDVFESIFRDVIDLHTSQYIHIGADETRLLGSCAKCADFVEKYGTSELFVQYVSRMCRIVTSLGKTPIIWGDIIAKHPEAVDKLPKNLIIMEWNYGWDLKHFGDIDRLIASGLQVWGAPALRSHPDNLYLVMWGKHLGNLENYVSFCRQKGFCGLIETSWSTSGEYGYLVDGAGWGINDIQPIREVYPLAAFDLLQQAFFEACGTAPFDGHDFVRRYAREHYGLTGSDIDIFEKYFYTTPNVIAGATLNVEYVEKELSVFAKLKDEFSSLRPASNSRDFEQLKLMLDIRVNYLRFQRVNAEFESDGFCIADRAALAGELTPVLEEARALQNKFIEVNGVSLKNPAAAFGDWSYLHRMENIAASL